MSGSSDPAVPAGRQVDRDTIGALGLAAAAGIVAIICLLPIAVVAGQAASTGWAAAAQFLLRPRVRELLVNTTVLLMATVPLTLFIGVVAAWLVERTQLPAARVWRILLLAPLAVPSFVSSYAWSSVLPSLHGAFGAIMITTLAYFPFVFLPVSALLRSLDHADLEVARTLGATPWAATRRVLLPQLRPALCGGALLVALHLLAEFGVLEMMRYPTFTTAILQQYAIGFSTAAGDLLAIVLIGLCLMILAVEAAVRGRARIARLVAGAHQQTPPAALGGWTIPVLLGLAALTVAAVVLPVVVVTRWLLVAISGERLAGADVASVTTTTLLLAGAAGACAMAAAAPAAWLVQRRRSRLGRFAAVVEGSTFLASALPGVVVGLALVTLAVQWARPVYQTLGLLIVAYVILFVPRAVISWRQGLAATPPELSEAARALGSSSGAAARRVVLPLVAPSALAGFVLVFLATATELTATLLLSPTGTRTLATAFWAASDELDYASAAPYAAVMIALSAPLTVLLRHQILSASGAGRR
jgi:iron(III) transport system permease protein